MTDFILLTGFLGSGKTTLLRDFLGQAAAADTAVIVNEVGSIDIDGAVIAADGGTLPMALLSNGCVCCSIANDLLYTIEALVASRADRPFARIVLECSGLSRPGPIIRSLGELAAFDMRLRVVATYDCVGGPMQIRFEDAAAQLAAAQSVVLTKLDAADAASIATAQATVAGINPLASCVAEPNQGRRALRAFAMAEDDAPLPGAARAPTDRFEHPRMAVLLARFTAPLAWDDLSEWLENLAGFCGERLLRVKGLVRLLETPDPVLIQGVGTIFSPPRRLPGAAESGLVIIVRDLAPGALRDMQPGFPVTVTRHSALRALNG